MSKLIPTTLLSLSLFAFGCGGSESSPSRDAGAPGDGAQAGDVGATVDGVVAGDSATSDAALLADAGAAGDGAPLGADAAASDGVLPAADAGGSDVNLMAGFVRGTIAGEVLDFRGLVGATVGTLAGKPYLQIGGHKTLGVSDYWAINVPNAVGTYPCDSAPFIGVTLSRLEGGAAANMYASSGVGGSCTIQITAAAPSVGDVVKGTFTATITSLYDSKQTLMVTDGAFEAGRYQ